MIDESFELKLADFGFATSLIDKSKLTKTCGTTPFKTPQQHAKRPFNGKHADLFACAITLFMMVTRCQPFDYAKVKDPCYQLIAGNCPKQFWKVYEDCQPLSEELKDLLIGMLQLDPSARLTMDEILTHPWMEGTKLTKD